MQVGPYRVVQLPDTEVVSYSLDEELGYNFQIGRMAAWGPRIAFDALDSPHFAHLYLVDLVDQTLTVVATAAPGEERVWRPDISGNWVVWTEYHYAGPADAGALHWRVLARNLGTEEATVLDSGINSTLIGGAAWPAVAKVDGDLVAYASEAPRAGHPEGWSIAVRSLTGGTQVRTIATDQTVYQFDLADGNVVYSEGKTDKDLNFIYDTRLMISTVAHPEPVEVGRDAYEVSAGGDRFAWRWDPGAGEEQTPVPMTPAVLTATFDGPTPLQASVITEGPDPPAGWGPPLLGALYPAAAGDVVGWQDRQTDGSWDGELRRVAIWDARSGLAYQVEPSPNPLFVVVQDGWLLWNSDLNAAGDDITHVLYGVPIDAVLRVAASSSTMHLFDCCPPRLRTAERAGQSIASSGSSEALM